MAKTKDHTAAEAETSIENAAAAQTANAETDSTQGENLRSADLPLDGPAPAAKGATGADTIEGGGADESVAAIEGMPPVTIRRLRAVIAEIEGRNTDLHREALLQELVENHGATYDPEAGTFTVDGITASPATKRPAQILATWCSAARRAILSGAIPE